MVLVWLIGLLLIPLSVSGHEAGTERAVLTVTATGQLAFPPDTAFVTLGVETAGKSLAEAQRQNQSAMNSVAERLRRLRIEKEHIQTASFTVSPQYRPQPKRPADAPPAPPEIIGYVVTNTITVEVRALDMVGAVIEESLAAGANHFHGLHWALRDEQQAKLAALKQAAGKAREKAATLSEALQVKLIKLVNVTEASHVAAPMPRLSRATMAMESGGEPPVFSGEVKVEATVTLVFEIGPS